MDVPEPKSPSVAPSGTPPVATVEHVQRDLRLLREDVARLTLSVRRGGVLAPLERAPEPHS